MSSLIIMNWALCVCVRALLYYDFDWTIRFNGNITHSKWMYSTQFHLKKPNHSIYWFCFCCIQFVGHICQICLKQSPTFSHELLDWQITCQHKRNNERFQMWSWKMFMHLKSSTAIISNIVILVGIYRNDIWHVVAVRNPCEFEIFYSWMRNFAQK